MAQLVVGKGDIFFALLHMFISISCHSLLQGQLRLGEALLSGQTLGQSDFSPTSPSSSLALAAAPVETGRRSLVCANRRPKFKDRRFLVAGVNVPGRKQEVRLFVCFMLLSDGYVCLGKPILPSQLFFPLSDRFCFPPA